MAYISLDRGASALELKGKKEKEEKLAGAVSYNTYQLRFGFGLRARRHVMPVVGSNHIGTS